MRGSTNPASARVVRRLAGAIGLVSALYIGPFLPNPKVWPQAVGRLSWAGALQVKESVEDYVQVRRPLLLANVVQNDDASADDNRDGEYGCLGKNVLVSVIIPIHNEGAAGVEKVLTSLYASTAHKGHVELVLVNASCSDDSFAALETLVERVPNVRRVAVCFAKGGRGPALRAGAHVAKGEVLLFLHADTTLPNGYDDILRRRLGDSSVLMSAFGFGIDRSAISNTSDTAKFEARLSHVEAVANLRAKYLWLPYGDQALATTRANYERLGGFQPMAMMEDFAFSAHARKLALSSGQRILVLEDSVALCSPRRWERNSVMGTTLRNWFFVATFVWGSVPPETIFRWYYGKRV